MTETIVPDVQYAPNVLYMVALPVLHMGETNFGQTEQIITLLPDKSFATEFFSDETDVFIQLFKAREERFIGGHVVGYELVTEATGDGRHIVKVIQNVR